MPIWIDHVAIPVRSPEAAARFLGALLGIEAAPDGPDGELRSLRLDADAMLLFTPADSAVFRTTWRSGWTRRRSTRSWPGSASER